MPCQSRRHPSTLQLINSLVQIISGGENLCGRVPALGVLLADVGDGKTWRFVLDVMIG